MKVTINLPEGIKPKLYALIAKGRGRFTLDAVCLQTFQGSLVAIATNGRALGLWNLGEVPEGWDDSKSFLIAAKAWKQGIESGLAKESRSISINGDEYSLRVGSAAVTGSRVDGSFPPVEPLFSHTEEGSGETFHINPELFATAAMFLESVAPGSSTIQVRCASAKSPVLLKGVHHESMAVVMQVAVDLEAKGVQS